MLNFMVRLTVDGICEDDISLHLTRKEAEVSAMNLIMDNIEPSDPEYQTILSHIENNDFEMAMKMFNEMHDGEDWIITVEAVNTVHLYANPIARAKNLSKIVYIG